jgi:hypothetical protein
VIGGDRDSVAPMTEPEPPEPPARIVNPYTLPSWGVGGGGAIHPEDLLSEPPLLLGAKDRWGNPSWFRRSYSRVLTFSTGCYTIALSGREEDPLVSRLRGAGVVEDISPHVAGGDASRGLMGEEGRRVEDGGGVDHPHAPTGPHPPSMAQQVDQWPTPHQIFRGGGVVEKSTSLQEMTFSGLDELRSEERAWEVVKELGPGVGVGNWRSPKLVIVGGEPTSSGQGVYPFYSRAGSWLFRALRTIGWDECQVFLCNSVGTDGKRLSSELGALHEAFAPHEPIWIALGAVAARVTGAIRRESGVFVCEHPSSHCRNKKAESPRDYSRLLIDAGLPVGDSLNLAVHDVTQKEEEEGLAVDLADVYRLPIVISLHPDPPPVSGVQYRTVAKEKSEIARIAFVTGEVGSVSGAAKAVGCNYTALLAVAKREQWREERDRHSSLVREKALSKSAEVESREISKVRKSAWGAAVKAVDIVHGRLESGKYVPNAMDAARLVSMAMDLTTASGVGGEHEREKVRNRTIAQISRDLVQTLQSQFGKDVIDVKAVVRSKPDESS